MAAKMRRENQPTPPLPIDLLSNILSRLPITTLLRLKSVSKSWHTLIATSSDFANLHLRRHNHHRHLIFTANDRSLYSVNLHSPNSPAFNIRFKSLRFSATVGSCNGLLLCICDDLSSSNGVALVNPSTSSYRRIPKLKLPHNYLNVSYGFGYDFRSDDYKIVRIVSFVSGCVNGSVLISLEVMIFSLRSSSGDSWKLIEENNNPDPRVSPAVLLSCRNGVLVNNHVLHWMFWCDELNEHRIRSFDVCGEFWGEVPMPDYIETGRVSRNNRGEWLQCDGDNRKFDVVDLGVLDGCLCVLTRNFRRKVGNVDVWVMKEYGVKDSWFKLFVVGSELDVTGVLEVAPIAYSSLGSEVLVRSDKLSRALWYDLEGKRARRGDFDGVPDYNGVTVCTPSLVPLYGVTGVWW